ncbi:MAG: D-alanyl-D-alanine carboxypeptidase family protein [Gammaproteobacteria bacterium]
MLKASRSHIGFKGSLTWLAGLLCGGLLIFPNPSHAIGSAIVIDALTGDIVHETNAERLWYPASLTKVMTLYLTFKSLKSGRIGLEDKIKVSARAAGQPASRLGLRPGETLTVEQAVLAAATRSANDAAVLLAERLAGSELQFAASMNQQAKALGMRDTVFRNANGLPDKMQVTTARDMAILSRALLRDFPRYYKYFSMPKMVHKGKSYTNINPLLKSYPGADGIKTGYTCGSGYNLIGSAKRGGNRLIAVLLGADNPQQRTSEMAGLMNRGFKALAAGSVAGNLAESKSPALKSSVFELPDIGCRSDGPAVTAGSGHFGWSIIFGAFLTRDEANRTLARVRPGMGGFVRYGHPSIVRRMLNGVYLWHALWTGLKQDQAGQVCKKLWSVEEHCKVLHPSLFKLKNAQWM